MRSAEFPYADSEVRYARLRKPSPSGVRAELKSCARAAGDCASGRLLLLLALVVVGVLVLVITLSMSDPSAQDVVAPNPKALEQVAKGSSDFAISLYKAVRAQESGNIVVSPLSVQTILALVYHGAGGRTADQLATALKLPEDRGLVAPGFYTLLSSLKSDENITLEVANKVFAQAGFGIKPEFSDVARRHYLSEAQEVNFGDAAASAQTINQWVEERTRNKIKNLISADMLDALTRLVLVNAVYFKGNWHSKFDPEATTTQPFYETPTQKTDVQMMHIKKKFRYGDVAELDAQALVLPYEGDKVSMLILLPRKKDGLADLEAKLSDVSISDIMNNMYSTEVNVSLPRFKLEKSMDLNPILKALGIVDMFEDTANFSGISAKEGDSLKVSQVVQKAFIEVNEEGSEAAAATGIVFVAFSLPPPPRKFEADHPFVFVLWHRAARNPLFLGAYAKP
ncbi:leukocyte elastase inhibitor-like isoform X5 [Bacillus rossius redtenbacheri]|uniref:leukocyte elastase inhibitor-like isoform X5 n=2 Tax=Bacillus rossius redtenbacheri TaxID=93214 RepID=UPI002FDEB818